MTTFLPRASMRPARSAARPTAPPGSTTSFSSRKAKPTACAYFGVGNGDASGEQAAVDGEGDFAGDRGHQRVADGAAFGAMRFALSGTQRARMIVKTFGFGGHQLGLRIARLDRGGDARDQAAARYRRHHDIRRDAERRHVLGDFPAHRALARDHHGIVIGRHQRRAAFVGDVAGNGFAILAVAIVQHHLRAIGPGALALGERRVGGHHDGRLHVQELRRRRHALGMIAGRERDHAAAALRRGDRRQLVEGAAKLERAGPLQQFRFQEHPCAGALVERRRRQQRGSHRERRQHARGRIDIRRS